MFYIISTTFADRKIAGLHLNFFEYQRQHPYSNDINGITGLRETSRTTPECVWRKIRVPSKVHNVHYLIHNETFMRLMKISFGMIGSTLVDTSINLVIKTRNHDNCAKVLKKITEYCKLQLMSQQDEYFAMIRY